MNRNNKKNIIHVIIRMVISAVVAGIISMVLPEALMTFRLVIFNIIVIGVFVGLGIIEKKRK